MAAGFDIIQIPYSFREREDQNVATAGADITAKFVWNSIQWSKIQKSAILRSLYYFVWKANITVFFIFFRMERPRRKGMLQSEGNLKKKVDLNLKKYSCDHIFLHYFSVFRALCMYALHHS